MLKYECLHCFSFEVFTTVAQGRRVSLKYWQASLAVVARPLVGIFVLGDESIFLICTALLAVTVAIFFLLLLLALLIGPFRDSLLRLQPAHDQHLVREALIFLGLAILVS